MNLGNSRTPGEVFARTWTDSTGKHKIEADFVSLDRVLVALRTNDGRPFRIRLSNLSGPDQEYVVEDKVRQVYSGAWPWRMADDGILGEKFTPETNAVYSRWPAAKIAESRK
ncbi:MAG TPA: SHD1 domain-containing protein [Pirellulales bacterium]|nr:SHD1 domain-containing protein [Pirellulales bacterium]